MKTFIINKLRELKINADIVSNYDEPYRFYHNWNHVIDLLTEAQKYNILSDELFLAIVFHDIIYDPKANDNEEKSAELFYSLIQNDIVRQAILDTKSHIPTNEISKQLCQLDLNILYSNFKDFVDYEDKIFKEFQFIDYKTYKENRINFLEKYDVNKESINYVKYRRPKIAVYPGSFNPFHIGHLNILQKAEKIFDKVIIARGINPEKSNEFAELPNRINHRQIEYYDGLLTDFIDSLEYDVTIIRGLRNSTDLQYELTQYRFLQELKNDIKIVSIFCDKEYEHISSSSLRMLKKYGKDYLYLI